MDWSPVLGWLESTLGLPNTVLYCPVDNNQKKFKFMECLLQSYVNLFNPPAAAAPKSVVSDS